MLIRDLKDLKMLRTDRLFEIINMLRAAKAPLSAVKLAEQLEVTPRTIYRYIAMLQSMRIPIEGAVGVGYVMRKGYDLPSLNFDPEELEAIVIGLGLLARTGDLSLQSAAQRVLTKIETGQVQINSLQVSNWGITTTENARLHELRQAIRHEQKLSIRYVNSSGVETDRTILPIVLTYYIEVAVLSSWCTLREDFRSFRADKITLCNRLPEYFVGQGSVLRQKLDLIGKK
jgi:predicted DNA-binding transcriptional regulator YafY